MSVLYKKLFEPQQLGTSLGTIFTIDALPAANLLRGARVRCTNTTTGAVTATLHAVPSGGSASDANAIVKAKSINPNSYEDFDVPLMKAGDFFQGLAGAASSITIHLISGAVFS